MFALWSLLGWKPCSQALALQKNPVFPSSINPAPLGENSCLTSHHPWPSLFFQPTQEGSKSSSIDHIWVQPQLLAYMWTFLAEDRYVKLPCLSPGVQLPWPCSLGQVNRVNLPGSSTTKKNMYLPSFNLVLSGLYLYHQEIKSLLAPILWL